MLDLAKIWLSELGDDLGLGFRVSRRLPDLRVQGLGANDLENFRQTGASKSS